MAFTETDFRFIGLRFTNGHHTDNRRGVNCHYLAYMCEGWAHLASETEEITVQTGEMLYIPRGCRYQSDWYGTPVRFPSLAFRDLPDPENRQFSLQRIRPDDTDRALVLQIPLNRPVDCAAIGQLYQLLGRLLPRMAVSESNARAALIRKSIQYINRHPQTPVPELAQLCGISESGYYALFRAVTGQTPVAVKQKVLAEQAVALLVSTDLSVEAISDRLGFSSAAYLRKILHTHVGSSPREIRNHRLGI